MPDKNEAFVLLGKLEYFSINISRIAEDFKLELERLMKFLNYPKEKISKFIPIKFFDEFLKPLLQDNESLNIKEILKITQQRGKYNSYNTLSSYLHKLEQKGHIKSTKIKRENYYMLN